MERAVFHGRAAGTFPHSRWTITSGGLDFSFGETLNGPVERALISRRSDKTFGCWVDTAYVSRRVTVNRIVRKEVLSPSIFSFDVLAPEIARHHRPGNFVVIRLSPTGERIPLTIASRDPDGGTVRIVFQAVGKTSSMLGDLNVGDRILDLVGPLGAATRIARHDGAVVCVGGGLGIAPVLPIAAAHKEAGNRVITIIGARSANLLMLAGEMEAASRELIITTDDGTSGRKGFVTEVLEEVIDRETPEGISLVLAIGPVPMMAACCRVTARYPIPTEVSLNPIMVDATGMCGACRVTVGGETRFACVDGPEFDGHKVDFEELGKRLRMYREDELSAMKAYLDHTGPRCFEQERANGR